MKTAFYFRNYIITFLILIPSLLNAQVIDAGLDKEVCGTTVNLAAKPPGQGYYGAWTALYGSGQIVTPSNENTQIIDLYAGYNLFRWNIYLSSDNNLVDFDEVVVINNLSHPSAGNNQELCQNSTQLNANNPVIGTGKWTTGSSSVVFDNTADPVTFVRNLGAGTNTLRWTVTSNGCSAFDEVDITNNSVLAEVGKDQYICTSSYSLVASQGAGEWSVEGGFGDFEDAAANETTVSNLEYGDNKFRWTVISGNCLFYDEITITSGAITAKAGEDQTLCEDFTQLNATLPLGGFGLWTSESGSTVISDMTSSVSFVTSIGIGANTLRWTIQANGCQDYDELVLTNNFFSISAGIDEMTCTESQLLLASNDQGVTGVWSVVGGVGEFENTTDKNTTVNNLGYGENKLRWTGTKNGCPLYDEVTISNYKITANAGIDQSICDNQTNLAAQAPQNGGTGLWSISSGSSVVIVNAINNNTEIHGLNTGINTFSWKVTENGCADTDDVIITNNSVIVSAGPDQELCENSALLTATELITTESTGEWTTISGSGNFENSTAFQTKVNNLGNGYNRFLWTGTKKDCLNSDGVTITSNAVTANAGTNQSTCDDYITLAAEAPQNGGLGFWSISGSSAAIENPSFYNTVVINLNTGINTFSWNITNGVCIDSDVVTITNNSIAVYAGNDQDFCESTTLLTATESTGEWTTLSGSGSFENSTAYQTTVNNLAYGDNKFRWTLTASECSAYDEVTITSNAVTANAGTDQSICNDQITLAAQAAPDNGLGFWTTVANAAVFIDNTDNNTIVTNLNTGINTLLWSVYTNDNCSDDDEVSITNNQFEVNAGADQVRYVNNVFLDGELPSNTTGYWSILAGGGILSNSLSQSITVTNLPIGSSTFQWTVRNSNNCESYDEVKITFQEIDCEAGFSKNICGDNIQLQADELQGDNDSGIWSVYVGSGVVANASVFNSTVSGLSLGKNTFRWTCYRGDDVAAYDEINITNNSLVLTEKNQNTPGICEDMTTLQFSYDNNTNTLRNGEWQIVEGRGTFVTASVEICAVTGLSPGRNIFKWQSQNQYGCDGSTQDTIIYNPPPQANFTTNVENGCSPLEILFTNSTRTLPPVSLESVTYLWNFGDGREPSTDFDPSYIYTLDFTKDATVYDIQLIATSEFGCTGTITKQVEIYPELFVEFSSVTERIEWPDNEFAFENLSEMDYQDYSWDFDDGAVLSNNSLLVTHSFPYWGVYTIVLEATTTEGCTANDNLTVEISPSLVGIEELENELNIYSQDKTIFIDLESNSFTELNVFNLLGKKIISEKMNETSNYTINTELETGIYILKIKLKGGFVSRKIYIK